MDESAVLQKISDRTKGSVILRRKLDKETAQTLKSMTAAAKKAKSKLLDGLYLEEDASRYYPMGQFAAQLLGLTTIDGVGQSGLEKSLDKYLAGREGAVLSEIDGKGRTLEGGTQSYVAAVDGGTARLTIDYVIQSYAEQAAREAMEVNNARGVRVIVMNPQTGEILALCCKPDYDPNDPPRNDVSSLTALMRNRLVTDAYEPGSHIQDPHLVHRARSGRDKRERGLLLQRQNHHRRQHGALLGQPCTARKPCGRGFRTPAIPCSSSWGCASAWIGFTITWQSTAWVRRTGVDIAGEGNGIMIARERVKRVDMARIGFGQSIAVTPIQLITAASAAVNGGRLMKPYVVSEIADANGEIIERREPEVVSTPISEKTSATMRDLLEGVVEEGGGRNAHIDGYRIGGKTGTAQVYVDGVVSSGTHIGSFIGFAPIDEPRVAVLFIVDEANRHPDFGSVTAAPFARDILEKTLAYLGVPRKTEKDVSARTLSVPDVTGMTVSQARSALKQAGFQSMLDGAGQTVIGQMPQPGAMMSEKSIVMLYAEGQADLSGNAYVEVPDVAGLSISEANRLLQSCGLEMRISGSGVAYEQSPEAGDLVTPTTRVTVLFRTPE